MNRYIETSEATAVIADYFDLICDTEYGFDETEILRRMNANAIDAVPSEMLYDIIKQIGAITYGKERFFKQDKGIWYDRKYGDYIPLIQVIERIVEAVKENEE